MLRRTERVIRPAMLIIRSRILLRNLSVPFLYVGDMSRLNGSCDSWSLGERSLAYDPDSAIAGSDVAELQGLLGGLGYQLPDDGIYGPTTADQVRRFQKHRGLAVDGVFGPATLRELSRVREFLARPAEPHYLRGRQL